MISCRPNLPISSLTIALLTLIGVGLVGCGGAPEKPSIKPMAASFCPPAHTVKADLRNGQRHRWCEKQKGKAHGPMKAFYPDGSQMLSFGLIDGRVHGLYRAWHPTGRLAIKAEYQHGKQLGEATYRPPFGPPSTCKAGMCRGMQGTLDRPFCLETDIQSTFKKGHEELRACLEDIPVSRVFVASWTIDLLGQVYRPKVEAQDETADALACMADKLAGFRFPAPFGQTCTVSMEFELTNR